MIEPTCRHGVRMDRSCLNCGRFINVMDEAYREKQANFTRSIQDLEAMLEPLLDEIARAQAEVDQMERGQQTVPDEATGSEPGANPEDNPPDPRFWFKK